MDLKEINSQIEKWVKEGESNGNPDTRHAILIAVEKESGINGDEFSEGQTCVQICGAGHILVQGVKNALKGSEQFKRVVTLAAKESAQENFIEALEGIINTVKGGKE